MTVHSAKADCRSLAKILDIVGDKWTVMIVASLAKEPMRFNALMRDIGGISHRMLTLTLRSLEANGLVSRTAYATIPPKVEYDLTELGRSLIEPLRGLAVWATERQHIMERCRLEHEQDKTRAKPIKA